MEKMPDKIKNRVTRVSNKQKMHEILLHLAMQHEVRSKIPDTIVPIVMKLLK